MLLSDVSGACTVAVGARSAESSTRGSIVSNRKRREALASNSLLRRLLGASAEDVPASTQRAREIKP